MRNLIKIITVASIIIALQSCVTATRTRVVYQPVPVQPTVFITAIPIAPPALVMTMGPGNIRQPGANFVWIDGFWQWNPFAMSYTWVNGHWIGIPHNNAIWMPGFWDFRGPAFGYVWVNAGWAPRNHRMQFGIANNRFDYFGRPLYFARPAQRNPRAQVFSHDHRPQFTDRSFTSSPTQNNLRSSATRNDVNSSARPAANQPNQNVRGNNAATTPATREARPANNQTQGTSTNARQNATQSQPARNNNATQTRQQTQSNQNQPSAGTRNNASTEPARNQSGSTTTIRQETRQSNTPAATRNASSNSSNSRDAQPANNSTRNNTRSR